MTSNFKKTMSPHKSPAKFNIHEEDDAFDATPKASNKNTRSSGMLTGDSTSDLEPPPRMALLTSHMANLNHGQVQHQDEQSARLDQLLSSLDKVDTGRRPSPSCNSKPKVAMPIGSNKPRQSTSGDAAASQAGMDEVSSMSKNSDEDGPSARLDDAEHNTSSDKSELQILREQLAAANGRIAALDQELTQQCITSHSLDAVLGSDFDFVPSGRSSAQGPSALPSNCNNNNSSEQSNGNSPQLSQDSWVQVAHHGPHRSGVSLGVNSSAFRSGWGGPTQSAWAGPDGRFGSDLPQHPFGPQPQRPANLRVDGLEQGSNGFQMLGGNAGADQGFRRPSAQFTRPGSAASFYNGSVSSFPGSSMGSTPAHLSPPMTPMSFSMGGPQMMPFPQQQYNGMSLSPTASEFTGFTPSTTSSYPMPWGAPSFNHDCPSSYAATSEPMNYRRLLERNQGCDWKYIVDKIVCSNDQQASIFLQQKLKVASPEQKFEMIESIIPHAYPLMINRFGNFLIQRCLEHGLPEQVLAIAESIAGNVLNLSMDAFGCHVVQKALDVVPEGVKASFVQELLHRIPETVVHRYACHVWQKLFELRWNGSPPQIMKRVNEALRGMWHEVALGETGSLVVQNIFENCLEEDKRPCINEVLARIDMIAHGQFGNWCIQHICEHGLPPDKSRAIEHVLRFAADYSVDQFASKVVEKCLKVGGPEFMDRYLERVCEGRADRPRMPLIDIAGDQFGNYIVQYILVNAAPHTRETVCNHIRKHMVSLRGSKFGSRVAMLCTNPGFSTRPGPPSGPPMMNNRYPSGPPMGPGMGRPAHFGPMYRNFSN